MGSTPDTFTLWVKLPRGEAVDEWTLLEGEDPPPGDHSAVKVFVARDWADACRQQHEFLGWEPYKPMPEPGA